MFRVPAFLWVLGWLLGLAGVPAENYFNEGNRWYRAGRFDLAEQAYRRAAPDGKMRGRAYYNAGNAAYQRGDYTRAMADFEAALELDPDDDDAWHNLELARRRAAPPPQQRTLAQNGDPRPVGRYLPDGASAGPNGREDIFTLAPEDLAEYIRTQTLAGYPFRPGSSLPKHRTEQDEVEDW